MREENGTQFRETFGELNLSTFSTTIDIKLSKNTVFSFIISVTLFLMNPSDPTFNSPHTVTDTLTFSHISIFLYILNIFGLFICFKFVESLVSLHTNDHRFLQSIGYINLIETRSEY